MLIDAPFNGAPSRLLLQASRNGYFYVLDRETGRNLLTKPFATTNWAKGIDQDGGRFRIRPRSRHGTAASSRPTKAAARTIGRRASIREQGCSSSARTTRTESISSSRITAPTVGRALTTVSTGRACCGPSTIGPVTVRWHHDLGEGAAGAGVLTTASGSDVHRRHGRQRARIAHDRRQDVMARGDRTGRQLADHLRARRPAVRAGRRRIVPIRVGAAGRSERTLSRASEAR